ncbi:hypothetical protein niasHS_000160 [Heterodera schachtii]|uniref:Uncharacterized protein n=1 Tax=Heterodera schachtii TaxID=97005 RepID=A0ABD2KN91_HETSC
MSYHSPGAGTKATTFSDCGREGHRNGAKKCHSPKEDRAESRLPAISPKIKETLPKKAESRARLPIRGPVPIAPRKPSPPSPKVKTTTESSLRRWQHLDLPGMAYPDLSRLARISTDGRAGTSGYGGVPRFSYNERPGNSGYGNRPASAVEPELIEAVRSLQSVVDELRKSIPPKLTGGNTEPLGRRKKRDATTLPPPRRPPLTRRSKSGRKRERKVKSEGRTLVAGDCRGKRQMIN